MKSLKIGDRVKHVTGGWEAIVSSKKYNYAYGLGAKTREKMWLYKLKNDNNELLMGNWSENEVEKINSRDDNIMNKKTPIIDGIKKRK